MRNSDRQDLWLGISGNCGSMDLDTVKRFYYGFMKYVVRTVKTKGIVQLPDFGKFELRELPERRQHSLYTNQLVTVAPRKSMGFVLSPELKDYLNDRIRK